MTDPMQWCRERLLKAGNPLAASLHFAPAQWQDAILALRAVLSEIAGVSDTVSDVDVGRRKLAWWRKALEERATHPAIEALVASGAADRMQAVWFEPLIDSVANTLEPPRFERMEEAWAHCLSLGGQAARLEAALIDGGLEHADAWAPFGAFSYLVRVVRDLSVDARAHCWLVPLDLQADYQISREEVALAKAGRGLDGLVRAWLDEGLRPVLELKVSLPPERQWAQRHLLVAHALDVRLARKLARQPRRIQEVRVQTGHPGNLWRAWRSARHLRKDAARAGVSLSE